jgi:hypothetical protein
LFIFLFVIILTGGAIYSLYGVVIAHSNFSRCGSTISGGAVFSQLFANVSNSSFSSCSSGESGGGLYSSVINASSNIFGSAVFIVLFLFLLLLGIVHPPSVVVHVSALVKHIWK